MTAVELDIILSSDGELVIHHDAFTNPKLCRQDDGAKIHAVPIGRLSVKELKKLDCGSLKNEKFPAQRLIPLTRILTLPEFFMHVQELEAELPQAKNVLFNLDAKFPPRLTPTDAHLAAFAKQILRTAAAAGMTDRIMVQSFEIRLLPFIKDQNPAIRTAALFQWSKWPGVGKRTPDMMLARAEASQADIIAPNYRDTDQALVDLAHKSGFAIIPWTVNEATEMRAFFKLGVDGIITDYPDRLKAVADEQQP